MRRGNSGIRRSNSKYSSAVLASSVIPLPRTNDSPATITGDSAKGNFQTHLGPEDEGGLTGFSQII